MAAYNSRQCTARQHTHKNFSKYHDEYKTNKKGGGDYNFHKPLIIAVNIVSFYFAYDERIGMGASEESAAA